MPEKSIFNASIGLNNHKDPTRMQPVDGVCELAETKDVLITSTGRIISRGGISLSLSGSNCHSIFSDGDVMYYVDGGDLYEKKNSVAKSLVSLSNVTNRVSYSVIGGTVYYSNGVDTGKIINSVRSNWDCTQPTGKKYNDKLLSNAPAGNIINDFNGRMYVWYKKFIFYSEPFAYSCFNMEENFSMQSLGRAICPVDDGIYFCSEDGIIFVRGGDPSKFEYNKVNGSVVVAGTEVETTADGIGSLSSLNIERNCWIVTTKDGVMVLSNNGVIKNLTINKLVLPKAVSGGAVIKNNHYLFTLNP